MALTVLSFFRDEAAAAALADTVAAHGGVLGAAVCCAEDGGDPADEWTTCAEDRDALLDRVLALAAARGLDVDFHVDENGPRWAVRPGLGPGLRAACSEGCARGMRVRTRAAPTPATQPCTPSRPLGRQRGGHGAAGRVARGQAGQVQRQRRVRPLLVRRLGGAWAGTGVPLLAVPALPSTRRAGGGWCHHAPPLSTHQPPPTPISDPSAPWRPSPPTACAPCWRRRLTPGSPSCRCRSSTSGRRTGTTPRGARPAGGA